MKRYAAIVGVIGLLFLAGCVFLNPFVPGPGTSGGILFFDDFEDDNDDAWVSSTYHWNTSEGKFSFYQGYLGPRTGLTFVLEGSDWSDYTVEADVWTVGSDRAIGMILYAQDDLSSMIIAWASLGKVWWEVLSDGEVIFETDPVEPGLLADREQHVEIVVEGDTYTYIVEGLERSTFVNTYYFEGMPGVAGTNNTPLLSPTFTVDNFRVTSLD